jgi:hypothetical protein
MRERSELIELIRGELVGPSRTLTDPIVIEFLDADYIDPDPRRRGPLGWRPFAESDIEEVLYYDRESPHRKYGVGLLHPAENISPDQAAAEASDTQGIEPGEDLTAENGVHDNDDEQEGVDEGGVAGLSDDFEVTSPDVRHPSTIGLSFCVHLSAVGRITIRLPQNIRFAWQTEGSRPFPLNGRYERCTCRRVDDKGRQSDAPMWRRRPAVSPNTEIIINCSELVNGKTIRRDITMPEGSPIALRIEAFPRRIQKQDDLWLLTLVLRNSTPLHSEREPREAILYQTYFDISVENGLLEKYPESQRPFSDLDVEEQSLTLLYRESATWGIGHGCAAGWDAEPGQSPEILYADVMPAVQLPSTTADIRDSNGNPIELSMRALSELSDDGQGSAWQSVESLAEEYAKWIVIKRAELEVLPDKLKPIAGKHLDECDACLVRIRKGISRLHEDVRIRKAFRLANLAMLLQQIATKQLTRRPLQWSQESSFVVPNGDHYSPWEIYEQRQEREGLGSWRAFQIAFLLMSLEGVANGHSPDREIVDLIWFPTGGGKTEAYLGVMSFYIFHERLMMSGSVNEHRDGTNVLMRYTLRMLTTQQFQRAAALICAMEFLRRNSAFHGLGDLPGCRFSLGLWIGGDGSPNKIADAKVALNKYRRGDILGNPLILTECPWCRAEIGRYDGPKPTLKPKLSDIEWDRRRTRGISEIPDQGPLLHCPDCRCIYGSEYFQDWLPVEIIDERIYKNPPSLVIATADKLAMIAYRPDAGTLFGRTLNKNQREQLFTPPGLIIQDELHLISGPLGTMYAIYEAIFERLCFHVDGKIGINPKLIASTATIRGADDQVKSLYNRTTTQLFPSPGLLMGDSFFGTYARKNGSLSDGRLYLGIHAGDYGSILTTQVRTFSSALFRPYSFAAEQRDPWWTLLVFYNSIRELSGAKTLFDSDIRSRLKFMFNREDFDQQKRRNLPIVEELTSRLTQAEIVGMMDRLSTVYSQENNKAIDACLASSIIEVGVDIDRLSLMGVVGQPKTTSQYIQVTGRVGRRWEERAGLILMIYNPSKSRDRSHFEQFHSYHRRLYERVEPTSVTPFALSAIQRGLPGALIGWARQHCTAPVQNFAAYRQAVDDATDLLKERCTNIQVPEDVDRSLQEIDRISELLKYKWNKNPQTWEEFPPKVTGEYLMLWPGQFRTRIQEEHGIVVASSMRQVDGTAELNITEGYALGNTKVNP